MPEPAIEPLATNNDTQEERAYHQAPFPDLRCLRLRFRLTCSLHRSQALRLDNILLLLLLDASGMSLLNVFLIMKKSAIETKGRER